MTPNEQQEFVKSIKTAADAVGELVKSGELDCAFVGITFGTSIMETGIWYEEFGNQCAVRQLSKAWEGGLEFKRSTTPFIRPYLEMLSKKELVAAVILYYVEPDYYFDHCGNKAACDWIIHEHVIRNDQIIRTQFATITAQNIAMQRQMGGGIITPGDLKGPNGPFLRN